MELKPNKSSSRSSPFAVERRKQQARRRLGSDHPVCAHCGELDWRCLELHHVGQSPFDGLTVILCRNCHRKVSDAQQDHPEALPSLEPSLLERIGHVLIGLADFFEGLIHKFREFGAALIELASQSLDPTCCSPEAS